MSVDTLAFVSAALEGIALALVLGLAAVAKLAPLSPSTENPGHARLLLFGIALGVLGAGTDLIVRTATLADVPLADAFSYIPRVLSDSDFGVLWTLRAVAWALLLTLWVWIRGREWASWARVLLWFGGLSIAFLISATGHASEEGLIALPNVVNSVHLVAMSLWGGCVVAYAFVILPVLQRSHRARDTVQAAQRLSFAAAIALVVVLSSGIFNSWHQLGSLSALWKTAYGGVLIIKILFVLAMLGIGANNRFRLIPKMEAQLVYAGTPNANAATHFLAILRLDSVLFLAVLITAAVLSMQVPPAHSG